MTGALDIAACIVHPIAAERDADGRSGGRADASKARSRERLDAKFLREERFSRFILFESPFLGKIEKKGSREMYRTWYRMEGEVEVLPERLGLMS